MPRKKKVKSRAGESARKFKAEMKKAMNTAIVAAFAFVIALSWKEVITEYVSTISAISPVRGKLIEAVMVTVIAVIGIMIVTKIFSEKNK